MKGVLTEVAEWIAAIFIMVLIIFSYEELKERYMSDTIEHYKNITRVEVIGKGGRVFTEYNAHSIDISFQDEGRTLKVFLNYKEEEE